MDSDFQHFGTKVSVSYTGGEWSGTMARDKISIMDSQNVSRPIDADIALIDFSKDFFIKGTEWEGIMGLAYSSLAKVGSQWNNVCLFTDTKYTFMVSTEFINVCALIFFNNH